mmetsp:Transcript_398/g.1323  ORF Transcript_398/g.1323 Transcript_398/m.1323 type:complete len:119 (+) Transcript_398:2308-2664(+)
MREEGCWRLGFALVLTVYFACYRPWLSRTGKISAVLLVTLMVVEAMPGEIDFLAMQLVRVILGCIFIKHLFLQWCSCGACCIPARDEERLAQHQQQQQQQHLLARSAWAGQSPPPDAE